MNYYFEKGLIDMTTRTRLFSAHRIIPNTILSGILLASFSPAVADPTDHQIHQAAQLLGLAQIKSAPVNTTNNTAHHYERKRQEQLRQNAERKRLRLVRLEKLRLEQLRQRKANQNKTHIRHGDIWQSIYQGFRFPNKNQHPLVKRYTSKFSKSPARLERLADRASTYLYFVTNELNRRNMPTELALLPFVESAYRNKAFSHAGAAGMWQFIPSTGRIYGLQRTGSYDERLDSFAATRAALDYLQKLNREFKGDWFLSLAAYNAGEGRVNRAIRENESRGLRADYWNLRLPRETKQYVPRLLAFKEIFRNPREFRVRLRGVPNTPQLTQVLVNKPVNLRHVAARAGLPTDTLTSLNPSYLHGITTPRFSKRIILPREHASKLHHAIRTAPAAADVHNVKARRYYASTSKGRLKKRSRHIKHKIRKGDSLFKIARRHGTTIKSLKRLNRLKSNKLSPGKYLKVSSSRYSRNKSRRYSKRYITHKVKRGDNLFDIARKHGTTVKKIKRLNNLNNNKIKPGKRLKIAARKSSGKRHS